MEKASVTHLCLTLLIKKISLIQMKKTKMGIKVEIRRVKTAY